ncbi:MAG: hypothetical protein ACTSP4_00940 [Candidatus Hodarchaeales archaeon]
MTYLWILSEWDQLFEGWIFMISGLDDFLWQLLILIAFIVRAIACIVFIYSLGERLYWEQQKATKRMILCILVFVIVTVPFAFIDREAMLIPNLLTR